jgi:hypothetical protein
MGIEDTTPIDIVAELERAARDRHMLHQTAEPSSAADELKLLGDLHCRASRGVDDCAASSLVTAIRQQ